MPIRILGDNYPDNSREIVRSKKLGPKFHEFLKSVYAGENSAFLRLCVKRNNIKGMYDTFIAPGAQHQIQVNPMYRQEAAALARDEEWSKGKWKSVLDDMELEIAANLNLQYLRFPKGRFWQSKQFREFLFETYADPGRFARQHGIRNKKDLADAMFVYMMERPPRREAKKMFDKLEKKEKLAKRIEKLVEDVL